mmetsp:Transcript_29826/g.43410  ORF Transcript_29826/g.43410 Transcript_29826/m.43410 type:complete len:594 (-) Transcript_29826:135-1916(-)
MTDIDPNCRKRNVDFIIKEGDPDMLAVEDDIRKDLLAIGIEVNTRIVDAEEYVKLEENGDYNLFFTRSWGAPYDPHTYLSSWKANAHVEYSATGNLEPPMTREILLEKIASVQRELDEVTIQDKWTEILTDMHQQAIFLPLWGTRVPYILNRRLAGFTPSHQTYTYPIDSIRILSGPTKVTVAPGAGGSLFKSAGPIHPHQYFPNQLFTQAWVYEGLVGYGQDGEIVPVLAESWDTEDWGPGQRVTFTLREGVKFHDGADFNCTVAKLNFDHVLSDSAKKRHSWLGAVNALKSWDCNEQGQFVLETSEPFYPLLQELTYIRPLTMASPNTFASGLDSHPELENSCNPGASKWKNIEAIEDFNCAGLAASIGTGPFEFVSREANDNGTGDKSVLFARHDDYWGPKPEIELVELKAYEDTDAVEAALLSGELDMALGIGPLSAMQVQDLKFHHSKTVDVRHSDVLQHSLMVMNTNKVPTNDIRVRQAIIHAVNKGRFIQDEFGGLEQPIDQVLPRGAPYCNIDLNPKWAYDLAKAKLLNCPESSNDDISSGAIAGIVVGALVVLGLLIFVLKLIQREKAGKPMFMADATGKGETA